MTEGVIQRTDAWRAERLGVITSTRAHDLLSSNTTRITLKAVLTEELLLAGSKDSDKDFQSASMERGARIEPELVSYYSLMTGQRVTDTDTYIESVLSPMFASSPDGLVGKVGGLEGKRLDEHNHLKLLYGAPPDIKYVRQCKWNLFVTGREWWDLFHYCETLPDSMRGHTIRIERDEAEMAEIEQHALGVYNDIRDFLGEHRLGSLLG